MEEFEIDEDRGNGDEKWGGWGGKGGGKREKSWNITRQWILLILSMINAIIEEEGKDK